MAIPPMEQQYCVSGGAQTCRRRACICMCPLSCMGCVVSGCREATILATVAVLAEASKLPYASDSVQGRIESQHVHMSCSMDHKRTGISKEERQLLEQLRCKREAAASVFEALSRAEQAAVAAASASGVRVCLVAW